MYEFSVYGQVLKYDKEKTDNLNSNSTVNRFTHYMIGATACIHFTITAHLGRSPSSGIHLIDNGLITMRKHVSQIEENLDLMENHISVSIAKIIEDLLKQFRATHM